LRSAKVVIALFLTLTPAAWAGNAVVVIDATEVAPSIVPGWSTWNCGPPDDRGTVICRRRAEFDILEVECKGGSRERCVVHNAKR